MAKEKLIPFRDFYYGDGYEPFVDAIYEAHGIKVKIDLYYGYMMIHDHKTKYDYELSMINDFDNIAQFEISYILELVIRLIEFYEKDCDEEITFNISKVYKKSEPLSFLKRVSHRDTESTYRRVRRGFVKNPSSKLRDYCISLNSTLPN